MLSPLRAPVPQREDQNLDFALIEAARQHDTTPG
jgi:hypothetical protein